MIWGNISMGGAETAPLAARGGSNQRGQESSPFPDPPLPLPSPTSQEKESALPTWFRILEHIMR